MKDVEVEPEARAMLCVSCFRLFKARLRCHIGTLESLTHGMQEIQAPLPTRTAVTDSFALLDIKI